jgi:hypothetical protein
MLLVSFCWMGKAYAQALNDLVGYWGQPYIQALAERNIVAGFPDGTFKPNDQVTRAQFAAMVAHALELPNSSASVQFNDLPANYWGNKAIGAVSSAGLVTGFPDGTFHPNDNITRAQALVILSKAVPERKWSGDDALRHYSDFQAIPPWAVAAIEQAARAHVIVSYPEANVIQPNSIATRGELAAMTYQTLAAKHMLPPLAIGVLEFGPPREVVAVPPPTIAVPLKPQIASITSLTPPTLRAGQSFQIQVVGTPHVNGLFRITGVGEKFPLVEVTPGNYEGKIQIPPGVSDINANVFVALQSPNGQRTEEQAPWTVTFHGQGPVINPVSPIPYTYVPGRRPTIRVQFANAPAGINPGSVHLFVNNADVTLQSIISGNSIAFQPPLPLPGHKAYVTVTAADPAGDVSERKWMFYFGPPPQGYVAPPPMTPLQEVEQGVGREIKQLVR